MAEDLSQRNLKFALSIIKLFSSLDKTTQAQVIGKQMLRSGTSVGAHYREASRARSKQEFVAKIDGGLQELEETRYWLDLLQLSGIGEAVQVAPIAQEAKELTAILTTMSKNTKVQIS